MRKRLSWWQVMTILAVFTLVMGAVGDYEQYPKPSVEYPPYVVQAPQPDATLALFEPREMDPITLRRHIQQMEQETVAEMTARARGER